MAQVYVSVGSNIDRVENISSALQQLAMRYGELQQSSVYESDAIGFDSEPFYNMVLGFDTQLSPQAIQAELHAIEDHSGRERTTSLSARTLDLDLLLYEDQVLAEGKLLLPRDDITRYAFVLAPLAEIAGCTRHPVSGIRYSEMWAAFDDSEQTLTRIDWPVDTVR